MYTNFLSQEYQILRISNVKSEHVKFENENVFGFLRLKLLGELLALGDWDLAGM
jgi:hypothetical protein